MGGPDNNLEREVKLDVGLRFQLPDLNGIQPGVVATRMPDAKLQAIYIDTEDLRLMRWGLTLRHRRDSVGGSGAECGWTLKLPVDADGVALVRNELTWPGPLGPVPAEVLSLVRAHARTARLAPVAKLVTERHRVEVRDGDGHKLAEVDDDVVSVMDGRRLAARFRQVELEVSDEAPDELLEHALGALTTAGAVPGDDRPKVVRAIGPRASLGPDVVIPDLDRTSSVATVVAAAIAAGVTRIIRHDPGVRLGDDPEHVHQARVGTRRLRSDLRTFWRLLDPDWAGPIRAELGWLAAALGEVRDADVLMGRFREQIRSLAPVDAKPAAALLRRLAAEREEARVRLLAVLDSNRYVALLDNLAAAAADPPLARQGGDRKAPAPVPPLVSAAEVDLVVLPNGPAADGVAAASVPVVKSPGPVGGLVPTIGEVDVVVAVATVEPVSIPVDASVTGPPAEASVGGGRPGGDTAAERPDGRAGADAGGNAGAGAGGDAAGNASAGAGADAAGFAGVGAGANAAGNGGAQPGGPPPGPGERAAIEVLPALVRRPWKHLRSAVDCLGDDPPDEALHEVRIRAKRMRYAAEAVAGVAGRPARQLAAAVAAVQGVLGDMQDAVVAETWLRRHASGVTAGQAMVAGQLITLQRQQQAACRAEWVKPWKAASKKALRKWLKG
jgi:CHAD domain-containing protein